MMSCNSQIEVVYLCKGEGMDCYKAKGCNADPLHFYSTCFHTLLPDCALNPDSVELINSVIARFDIYPAFGDKVVFIEKRK